MWRQAVWFLAHCRHVSHQVPLRGDIHMLVVGDPGLGKSQLLQASLALQEEVHQELHCGKTRRFFQVERSIFLHPPPTERSLRLLPAVIHLNDR